MEEKEVELVRVTIIVQQAEKVAEAAREEHLVMAEVEERAEEPGHMIHGTEAEVAEVGQVALVEKAQMVQVGKEGRIAVIRLAVVEAAFTAVKMERQMYRTKLVEEEMAAVLIQVKALEVAEEKMGIQERKHAQIQEVKAVVEQVVQAGGRKVFCLWNGVIK